jgi:ribonuclease Y
MDTNSILFLATMAALVLGGAWFIQRQAAMLEKRLAADRDEYRTQMKAELEEWEQRLAAEQSELDQKQLAMNAEQDERLHKLAGVSREEARAMAIAKVEAEIQDELLARIEAGRADAEAQARRIVLDVIQRNAAAYVSESTTTLVPLPSEDFKGRLIGREGRNIRSFEQITGVDLLIDETPDSVVLSTFDPVRREVARLTLEALLKDGRIQPQRIEELHQQAVAQVQSETLAAAEDAVKKAGVGKLPEPVMNALGKLKFRLSYGQNVLDHSVEVASFAGNIAAELGLPSAQAKRAGLLHDIGKALDQDGPHALVGMEFMRAFERDERVLNAIGAHHYDIDPNCAEAQLVIAADTLSASRPGARRESLEAYLQRMKDLEALVLSFEGVERVYAVQAGREVRVMVKPDVVDDAQTRRLAKEIGRRIHESSEIPGQVKVVVIRELRATNLG